MTLPWRALSAAEEEVDHAAGYYEIQSPGVGRIFFRAYEGIVAHLVEFPRSGQRLDEYTRQEVRAFQLGRFPHTVIVLVQQDEIVIVAVAHHSREPGYWRERLRDV